MVDNQILTNTNKHLKKTKKKRKKGKKNKISCSGTVEFQSL
jgi:hypothetical protein